MQQSYEIDGRIGILGDVGIAARAAEPPTWTRSRTGCWVWWHARWSRPGRRCGYDRKRHHAGHGNQPTAIGRHQSLKAAIPSLGGGTRFSRRPRSGRAPRSRGFPGIDRLDWPSCGAPQGGGVLIRKPAARQGQDASDRLADASPNNAGRLKPAQPEPICLGTFLHGRGRHGRSAQRSWWDQ